MQHGRHAASRINLQSLTRPRHFKAVEHLVNPAFLFTYSLIPNLPIIKRGVDLIFSPNTPTCTVPKCYISNYSLTSLKSREFEALRSVAPPTQAETEASVYVLNPFVYSMTRPPLTPR